MAVKIQKEMQNSLFRYNVLVTQWFDRGCKSPSHCTRPVYNLPFVAVCLHHGSSQVLWWLMVVPLDLRSSWSLDPGISWSLQPAHRTSDSPRQFRRERWSTTEIFLTSGCCYKELTLMDYGLKLRCINLNK